MPDTLALYIHWPFCLAKCPYCDFNSHVREQIPQVRFAAALRQELAWEGARLNMGLDMGLDTCLNASGKRRVTSIFFGGGTPSLMAPETVAALIEDAATHFDLAPDAEITLEANPTSVELQKLTLFRQAGINRLSLGVQALDDAALRALGRQHSATQALAALEHARATFPRLSFDLIYARPGQTMAAWQAELARALALAADHLSLYQLTIEPGTVYEALHRSGQIVLPTDEDSTALYDATGEAAAKFGLHAYEISNYAKPGAESRHNLAYWRYQDYAGIGPGAHGRVTIGNDLIATRRHRAPEPWADRVERQGHGSTTEELVSQNDRTREALLMGLRLAEGIDKSRFESRTGTNLDNAIHADIKQAAIEADYLTETDTCLTATPTGRRLLDALLARLVV